MGGVLAMRAAQDRRRRIERWKDHIASWRGIGFADAASMPLTAGRIHIAEWPEGHRNVADRSRH